MKRKYYLRGLGLGILITSLVFIVAGPSEPTEEEIIKRAEELGYVKGEEAASGINLKDLLGTGTPVPSPTEKASATKTPVPTDIPEEMVPVTETPEPTAEPTETLVPTATSTPVPTLTPVPTKEPVPTPTLTPVPTMAPTPTENLQATATPQPTKATESSVFTADIAVERGDSATKVCKKIQAAGILNDGDVLLNYLISNQLVDYINIGTYTMSSAMTLEEMAKQLTGR